MELNESMSAKQPRYHAVPEATCSHLLFIGEKAGEQMLT